MAGRRIAFAVMALSIAAAPAFSQSLGELARQEEARRATSKSVKTLSNSDLGPSAIVAPAGDAPAEPSCYMSISKGRCVSAQEMLALSVAGVVTRQNAPHEQTWRNDAAALRTQIEATQRSIATLEAVVADAGRSAGDKKAAVQNLVISRRALEGFEQQWEKLEKNAGNEKVPRTWLEPIPTLSKNQPQ